MAGRIVTRRVRGVVVVGVLLGAIVAACAPTAPPATGYTANDITITQTPSGAGGPCVAAASAISSGAMTYQTALTASSFALTITLSKPLCTPIVASAAIYRMPGGGYSWPQTFAASKQLTLLDADQKSIYRLPWREYMNEPSARSNTSGNAPE